MKKLFIMICFALCIILPANAQQTFEKDKINTSAGELEITFIGHGTLMLTFGEKIIHIDPWRNLADYKTLPKADVIILTHHHPDHFDRKAIELIRIENTVVILTEKCAKKISGGVVMKNGDTHKIDGITVEAIPAYNLEKFYHPKGEGNGYVLTFGNTRIYIAGDTENTPEMKALKNIDYAFLPMNLPYTMTPQMVADAAIAFKPKVLYPYHFGETDTSVLVDLLKDHPEIELRIRKMK
jgi:L-ascorbate metabolism protein UlaG (beta-lactamase superfamily)